MAHFGMNLEDGGVVAHFEMSLKDGGFVSKKALNPDVPT